MKTILIMNQKGGVGKTLIADELAYALERDEIPFNFYDLDGQGSARHQANKVDRAEVQIVDTAGALNDKMLEWMAHADFVIIPTMMSASDMRPLVRMIEICGQNAVTKPVLYVFNRFNRFSVARDFCEWFDKKYPDLKTITLAETVAFQQAHLMGESIVKYQPNNKGAKDIDKIYSIIKFELGLKSRRSA